MEIYRQLTRGYNKHPHEDAVLTHSLETTFRYWVSCRCGLQNAALSQP
jgi:hypothetical protein